MISGRLNKTFNELLNHGEAWLIRFNVTRLDWSLIAHFILISTYLIRTGRDFGYRSCQFGIVWKIFFGVLYRLIDSWGTVAKRRRNLILYFYFKISIWNIGFDEKNNDGAEVKIAVKKVKNLRIYGSTEGQPKQDGAIKEISSDT